MNAHPLVVALAALTAGVNFAPCQSGTTLKTIQEPMLEFTVVGAAESAEPRAPTIESAAAGGVTLSGAIATPNPCYEVTAALGADGRRLTLTLTATAKGGFCPQVVAAFDYRAQVTGLAPGAYELVTVHRYPETGWEEQSFQLQIEVP